MSIISPTDLHRLITAGTKADLIDVRSPAEWKACHIAGTVLEPLDRLDPAAVWNRKTSNGPLFILCQGGVRAKTAAGRFEAAGFAEVVVVDGGTSAWVAAGLPVERSGGSVFGVDRQVRVVAGALAAIGGILALTVNPAWAGLSAFVGCGLVFAGLTEICPMATLLAVMPWNRSPAPAAAAGSCCGAPSGGAQKAGEPVASPVASGSCCGGGR